MVLIRVYLFPIHEKIALPFGRTEELNGMRIAYLRGLAPSIARTSRAKKSGDKEDVKGYFPVTIFPFLPPIVIFRLSSAQV